MADYIPSGEAAKMRWMWNLMVWLMRDGAVHGLAHGFTLDEVCALVSAMLQVKLAADNAAEKQAAARAAVVVKKEAIARAVRLARADVRRLQADPDMTDADRANAGITVADTTATPLSAAAVHALATPDCDLDFSKRHQVIVHVGFNPHNERENGHPAGTIGCMLQCHRGGVPEHEEDWVTLGIVTDSPFIHSVHENEPTTYAYRACWIDKKLKLGPYGDPAVCTVSV